MFLQLSLDRFDTKRSFDLIRRRLFFALVIGNAMIVRLSRDVKKGEELTIQYYPRNKITRDFCLFLVEHRIAIDTYVRTKATQEHYGFKCDCARCDFYSHNKDLAEL